MVKIFYHYFVPTRMKEGVNINDNNISQILDLIDENSSVTEVKVIDDVKYVTIEKNIDHNMVCPCCGHKLYSKGKFIRHPNNQVLQDGYTLNTTVIGRRWKCSNEDCDYIYTDTFNFIEKRKRQTKIIDFQILETLKDINLTCVQIAQKFKVSDTYVHQPFLRYVDLPRLELTKYICIDEVYLNLSPDCKYALIIMDFMTGDIIDIVRSRRKKYTENYFLSIPKTERDRVECLCCDMYNPYINYTEQYFLHSVAVTDSFHVLQWLLHLINIYINDVKKKYQANDKKKRDKKNYQNNSDNKTIKDSKEVYILKNFRWVLLESKKNIKYHESKYDYYLNMYVDTYQKETMFLKLDENFTAIRNLKELYEEFNESYINDLDGAAARLDELIDIYNESNIKLFRDFAQLLVKYKTSIINSFTYVKSLDGERLRRISNGPLESFNKIVSMLRTLSHGVDNFDYVRSRILWHCRKNPPIRGIPKTREEVHTPGKPRGPYNKNK